jgi:hypothetical protein
MCNSAAQPEDIHEQRHSISASCDDLVGYRPQEGPHRNSSSGKLTQALRKPKGRLFPTGEDIAQVRIGALSSLGKVLDGPSVRFSPAKHWMWF